MNINKADFGTIVIYGTLEDLERKLTLESKKIGDVVNQIDFKGESILHKALYARKFDIAKYLLQNNATLNIVSKEGYNELHYISANINHKDAIPLAREMVLKGASLNLVDKKYGNTALFSLCLEILKVRSSDGIDFIKELLHRDNLIDLPNKSGKSVRDLLLERGTDEIKLMLGEKNQ